METESPLLGTRIRRAGRPVQAAGLRSRCRGRCGGRRTLWWAFALNVTTLLLLAAAAASPWYATSSCHVPPTGAGNRIVTTERFYLWWWPGAYVHTTSTTDLAPSPPPSASPSPSPSINSTAAMSSGTTSFAVAKGAKGAVMQVAGWPSASSMLRQEGESTRWELIQWSERQYGLSAAKSVYHSSNALALLGLSFGVLLALCLFCGVAPCITPRWTFYRHFSYCRSLFYCFSCLTFLFTCLAWGLFLYFPTALGNRCVPKFSCDAFFGKASHTNHAPEESLTVLWSPFVGWGLALLSTPFSLVVIVLVCFVQKPAPPTRDYRLVINS